MKLPTEAELILSVIGQLDEQYQRDGDLGLDDILQTVLVPVEDRLGIDIPLLFQWLKLTRKLFGDIDGIDVSVLDKRFKELEDKVGE